ncbi:MAG: class I SAM-dependent methyltransferase, partial [Verrucomicrobiota bacterium]
LSGLDVADTLIDLAKKRTAEAGSENTDFSVGSVLDLGRIFSGRTFDLIVSQRCLINLPTWEDQRNAMLQARDLLADDGVFVLTEGFDREMENLNRVREAMGLDLIKVVDYNEMFVNDVFDAFVDEYFETVAIGSYGLYLYLSRVFHPLQVLPDPPRHDSPINELAMKLALADNDSTCDRYSFNKFYALKKK